QRFSSTINPLSLIKTALICAAVAATRSMFCRAKSEGDAVIRDCVWAAYPLLLCATAAGERMNASEIIHAHEIKSRAIELIFRVSRYFIELAPWHARHFAAHPARHPLTLQCDAI